MSERYAVQDGPWHLPSTWDGGASVPDDTDDVHAGGFEVTIHTSVKVKSLRLAAGGSAPAGGRFVVGPPDLDPGVTIEVTDGILTAHHESGNGASSSRTYILWVLDPGTPVTVVTPTIEGGAGSYRSGVGMNVTGASTVGSGGGSLIVDAATITGGGGTQAFGVRVDSADSTVTITGDITGGTNNTAHGLSANGGTVSVTGDITGSTNSSAYGLDVTGGTVDITGDITGGTSSSAYGLYSSGGSVTVTGDITGGASSSAYGLSATGGTVDITGDITGGSSSSSAYGVYYTGSAQVRVDGVIRASAFTNGIASAASATYPAGIRKAINHANGIAAVSAIGWVLFDAEDAEIKAYTDLNWPANPEGNPVILTRRGTNLPAAGDVREGTKYGAENAITGTMRTTSPSLSDIAAVTGAQIQAATNTDD